MFAVAKIIIIIFFFKLDVLNVQWKHTEITKYMNFSKTFLEHIFFFFSWGNMVGIVKHCESVFLVYDTIN